VQAGIACEEAFILSTGIALKVFLVEFIPRVQVGKLRDEILYIEAEVMLDEVGGIPTTVALFGSTAHLPQSIEPERQIFRAACAPHDHVVSVPAPPVLWRRLCSSTCRSLNSA
jgi:hypothetical protein